MIKKVVIPTVEVKYVCELSEEVFGQLSYAGNGNYHIKETLFKKIETPKPLAEDEISVEEINERHLYAIKDFGSNSIGIMTLTDIICEHNTYTFNYFEDSISASNITDKLTFNILTRTAIIQKWGEVYEFSGSNKQQEFFEWGLKQIKDNLND